MKRLWIALAILVAIFGASLLSAHWLDGFTGRLTGLLDQHPRTAIAATKANDTNYAAFYQMLLDRD